MRLEAQIDESAPRRVLFASRAELHEAVLVGLGVARRTVRVLGSTLSDFNLASRTCTDAMLRLMLADRSARIRLLVDDSTWLDAGAARLRLLQRRFPHALELRVASPSDPVGDDCWLLADDDAALEVRRAPGASGSLWLRNKPHAQPLIASFDRRWEAAGHNLPVSPLGLA